MWPFKKAERKPACEFIRVVHIKRLSKPCRLFIQCKCGRFHVAKQGAITSAEVSD